MYPAGDPIIQTLKFLMDQDLHNLKYNDIGLKIDPPYDNN